MTYEIRTDVPLPDANAGAKLKYPFGEMPVGGCFIVPAEADGPKLQRRLSSAVRQYGRRHGLRFTTRILPDGSVGVWRLPDVPEDQP